MTASLLVLCLIGFIADGTAEGFKRLDIFGKRIV